MMKGKAVNLVMWNCKRDITEDMNATRDMLNDLTKKIDMKPLGKPMILKGADFLPGVSGVRMIETSHLAWHGFKIGNAYIFTAVSCKDFDECKLLKYITDIIKPGDYDFFTNPIRIPVKITR